METRLDLTPFLFWGGLAALVFFGFKAIRKAIEEEGLSLFGTPKPNAEDARKIRSMAEQLELGTAEVWEHWDALKDEYRRCRDEATTDEAYIYCGQRLLDMEAAEASAR